MTVPRRDPIADELALRNLVHRYAGAVTRHAPEEIADMFVADGEWEVARYGTHRGHDEIAAFFRQLLTDWNALVQGLLSGEIVLDPVEHDRAHGRWYIFEFGQRVDGSEALYSGVYVDEYARDEGIWRFARRRYDSRYRRVGEAIESVAFPGDATFPPPSSTR